MYEIPHPYHHIIYTQAFPFCSHSYCYNLNETGTKQEQNINILKLQYHNSIKSMTYRQRVYIHSGLVFTIKHEQRVIRIDHKEN